MKRSRGWIMFAFAAGLAAYRANVSAMGSESSPPISRAASATAKRAAHVIATYTLPEMPLASMQNAVLPGSITRDRKILLGGIGSDLWRAPSDAPDHYWMVTDRGPNGKVEIEGRSRHTFLVPEFTPLILYVRCDGGVIQVLQTIPIVGRSGKPVTGLPNVEGHDQVPYDATGKHRLSYNASGLDVEGMVRTRSGDFWLVDEYAPSLVHVDANGKVVKRFVPADATLTGADYPIAASLPAIYGKRKHNRGFEGIGLAPDEKTVYLLLQSPLSNPDKKTGEGSRQSRVLAFDVASERPIAEYVYRLEVAGGFDARALDKPSEMKLSGVVALNPTTLLVLERTDTVAKLYLADSSHATNILGSRWDDAGTTPSLEAEADPVTVGVEVLAKKLVVDLSKLAGVPEKIEGIAVIDRSTIAIANDNDFDVGTLDAQGNNVGKGRKSRLLVVGVAEPLPSG